MLLMQKKECVATKTLDYGLSKAKKKQKLLVTASLPNITILCYSWKWF